MSWRLMTQSSSRLSCMGCVSSVPSTSVQRARTSFVAGVGLVARVEDRARGRGRAGGLRADVLGALGEAVVKAARGLEHLAGARHDLPGDEEGDERLGQSLEAHVAAHEIVLVAAVRVAGRIGVVLEQ